MKFATRANSTSTTRLELNVWGLILIFLTPMMGGFLYGFDIGATSFVLSMLLQQVEHEGPDYWWEDMSSVQQGLIVSGLSLGALIGSHLVLMYLSHKIGRRMELRICAMFYLIGTALNVASGTLLKYHWFGFWGLLVGRLCFGMGVGFIMHGAPAYMAEMCPPEIRGAVVSAKETVIVAGIVVGYATGNWMSSDPTQWTDLYAITATVSLPMLVLTYCIPRSKRWLLMKGLRQEAYESMQYVYKGDINDEFYLMVEKILSSPHSFNEEDDDYIPPNLCAQEYRPAMTASMGLIIFQQFSGQPSVLSYATVLFEAAGWSGNASVVTSVLMMFTSMTTVALVDRVGRKRLLLTCCLVMMTALGALSTTFWGWGGEDCNGCDLNLTQKNIILVAMFVYIGGYQIGFGPITWCIVSEVFPLEIRGKAIALGVELNYTLNFLVQFLFPVVQEFLGWGPSFCMFGGILAFAFIFIQGYVTETRGMSLEDIHLKLSGRPGENGNDMFDTERTSLLGGDSPVLHADPNPERMGNP